MPGELLRGLLKTLKRQKAELLREAFEHRALRKLYDGYTINPEQQLRHITTLIHLLEFIYPCRALKAHHHIDRPTQQALFFSIDSASIRLFRGYSRFALFDGRECPGTDEVGGKV